MRDWEKLISDRVACLNLQGSAEADLVEELSQHLQDRYRELCSGGMAEDEAFQTAVSELDDLHPLRAKSTKTRQIGTHEFVPVGGSKRGQFLDNFWRDFRYAGRAMRKSPAFVVFVILTLALGIGANTTVFTVINTLILNPLPVPNSGDLLAVNAAKEQSGSKSNAPLPLSYADLKDIQGRNRVFSAIAAYSSPRGVTWQSANTSKGLFVELVTGNYFPVLGLTPARGRFFLPEEDNTPGTHPVAVLNYGTWQTHFGGDPEIIGKKLLLNNVAFTIIGIAPPQFIGINAIFGPDVWLPSMMAEQLFPNEMHNVFTDRSKAFFQGIGRLQAQTTQAQAQANVATIAADLAQEYPATNEGSTAIVRPVRDVLFSSSTGNSTSIVFAGVGLLVVVAIVLLIACSNVANLLLARAASRQQEMAVRLAMGANRTRLVRQLLTESVLLGLLSGLAGLFIAYAGLHLLFGALPASANFIAPKFDARVFLFALLVSFATGLLFGALPALKTSSVDIAETLKEEARTMGRSHTKVTLANVLLVGQVAFSFLLLMTAGLFLRSISRAYSIDPGFQIAHLAVFMTSPGQAGYGEARTKAFYKDVRERVASVPGVESLSWASNLPLWSKIVSGLHVEGRQQRSQSDRIVAIVNTVDRNYFETAGVAMLGGREFTDLDQGASLPVAVVNEKMAMDYWPGQSALGKRIQLPGEKQFRQIVGIARTANYTNWAEAPQPCVYVPMEQKYSDGMNLYIRSKGDPRQVLAPIQQVLRTIAPQIKISTLTGRDVVNGGLFAAKVGVALLSVFGLLALGLASIGLYGILAYAVNQRKREIGLRMALGAGKTTVRRLILKQGMSLVLVGILIGIVSALLTGRFLSRMLYGVSASDPISLLGAGIVLMIVALLACYLPARGASRVDPLVALREG